MKFNLFPTEYEKRQRNDLAQRIKSIERSHIAEKEALEKEITDRKDKENLRGYCGCLAGAAIGFLICSVGLLNSGDIDAGFILVGALVGYKLMTPKVNSLQAGSDDEKLQQCIQLHQNNISQEQLHTEEDIAQYAKAFDEAVENRVARYAASEITKKLVDDLGTHFLRLIRAADRSQLVAEIIVSFKCIVHHNCVICNHRTVSFDAENFEVLPDILDQAALARALAANLTHFVFSNLPTDPSGTAFGINTEYQYASNHADVVITHHAINASYVPRQRW